MRNKNIFILFLLLFVLATPSASAARNCFLNIFARQKVVTYAKPIFSHEADGPVIRALFFNGKVAPRGSTIKISGKEQKILDWGVDAAGKKIVRVADLDGGNVRVLEVDKFQRGAFSFKDISLSKLLADKDPLDELAIARAMRDHPGLDRATAEKAYIEFKKLMFFKFRGQVDPHTGGAVPYVYDEIDTIDYLWHGALLFTVNYRDWSLKHFGSFLEHTPSLIKNPEAQRLAMYDYLEETLGIETRNSWFGRQDFNPFKPGTPFKAAIPFANPSKATALKTATTARDGFLREADVLLKSGTSKPGVVEILDQPVQIDSLFEVFAKSFPRGKQGGALYHIRPRAQAQKIVELEGANFTPLTTEHDSLPDVFNFLHRTKVDDPKLGQYYATQESPDLYNTLAKEWNEIVGDDPHRTINLFQIEQGANNQVPMAILRKDHRVAVAPLGKASSEAPEQLVVDPATGRIPDKQSLQVHDIGEATQGLTISKEILDHMSDNSKIWLRIREALMRKPLPPSTDPTAKELSDLFRNYAAKHTTGKKAVDAAKGTNGFTDDGAHWWRLAEIEMYRTQRGFHSFDHILSTLIRNPKGVNGNTVIKDLGPTFEWELNVHRWGLGTKTTADLPEGASPLLTISYREAQGTQPLTLEAAIKQVTNAEDDRLRAFANSLPTDHPDAQNIKKMIDEYLASRPSLSDEQIKAMADFQRERYRAMGNLSF